LSPAEIVDRAAQGNNARKAVLQRHERRLTRALAQAINILDPENLVVGSGVTNVDRLYENVPAQWTDCIFSDQARNRYSDSPGVRGAASLWSTPGHPKTSPRRNAPVTPP
jgi:fructokinase